MTVTGKATPDADMVLQPKPVPDVHISALLAPEQDGTARADGVVAVRAPRTVFAACEATFVRASPVPDQFALLMVTPEGSAPLAMPVAAGRPVPFVSVPEEGVPKAPPKMTKAHDDPVLMPRAVKTPVPVATVAGATAAPPPITSALAARTALDDRTVVELK